MTKYTKAQRRRIAAAFRAAKPNLWDGGRGIKNTFICWALDASGHPANYMAKEVISQRLDGESSLYWWLLFKANIPGRSLTNRALQAHRHAWLDLLIKEFEA